MAMSPLEEICKNNHACNADSPLQYALRMSMLSHKSLLGHMSILVQTLVEFRGFG